MIDWSAIRSDYEAGKMSVRRLALFYRVPKTTLIDRSNKENWQKPTTDRPVTDRVVKTVSGRSKSEKKEPSTEPSTVFKQPPPPDAISIARAGLRQLAESLGDDPSPGLLSLHDHKLLSDSLSQYVKVMIAAPPDTEQDLTDSLLIPLNKISQETRAKIREALVEDEKGRAV